MGGLWRGEFTVRRAAALAAHLPPGSAVWRDIGHDAMWGDEAYILAAVFDRLGDDKSEKYPRPDDVRRRKAHEDRALLMAERFKKRQERVALR